MKTKEVPTNSGCATTEGDELYYEVRGRGQPLLMIPGGGGDGGSYSLVAKFFHVSTESLRTTAVPMHEAR
jgi:pimeloyl-ACP methyl ester carboxylesterase